MVHDGEIVELGSHRELVSHEGRYAAMYATCAHPHCQVPFSACRIHHVHWWTDGGKTVLANLVPLCERHHHLVHEGGWNLEIDHRRHVTWTRPDGTIWHTDTGVNRPPPGRPPPIAA